MATICYGESDRILDFELFAQIVNFVCIMA